MGGYGNLKKVTRRADRKNQNPIAATFRVSKRQARTGRNPRTGNNIKILVSKAAHFRAGKALRDAVN